MTALPSCKICGAATTVHGRATVRRRHPAVFHRCQTCGFVFINEPDWLAEAYADPINLTDTGYVSRNLGCQVKTQMLIEMFLNPDGKFLDYAAGYGLFVRLMRDLGYDFRWADRYCNNLFARGFEEPLPLPGPYEAVTAFEVFEHLVDPLAVMSELTAVSPCLIFTTSLLPDPAPAVEDWWYYGLEHGQHVSFYSTGSLQFMARKFGYHLATDGAAFHALSKLPLSPGRFRRIQNRWWRLWTQATCRRPSRTVPDYEAAKKRLAEASQPVP
jgi:hypothetical protein